VLLVSYAGAEVRIALAVSCDNRTVINGGIQMRRNSHVSVQLGCQEERLY
jgi:hypothetical protein